MSQKEAGSGGKRRILEVTVKAQAGSAVSPRTITLNDSVLIVVWSCDDLPPDARLLIVFRKDPRGPFFLLESTGKEVIGWGNRGPETAQRFAYEAKIQTGTGVKPAGGGVLVNQATKPLPTTVYPTPPPPDKDFP